MRCDCWGVGRRGGAAAKKFNSITRPHVQPASLDLTCLATKPPLPTSYAHILAPSPTKQRLFLMLPFALPPFSLQHPRWYYMNTQTNENNVTTKTDSTITPPPHRQSQVVFSFAQGWAVWVGKHGGVDAIPEGRCTWGAWDGMGS